MLRLKMDVCHTVVPSEIDEPINSGGLSYLTDLYGMACDNIASYEVSVIFSRRTAKDDGKLTKLNR